MKKFTFVFAGILLLLNTVKAQDKAFHKGSIVFDLGIGVNVYKTQIQDQYNSLVINGGNLNTVRIKKDTSSKAGSAIYPLTIEYGLKNWLGIAAKVSYSSYFGTKDSVTGIKSAVRSIDGGIMLNLHLIKTKRFDMPIGLSLGYSNFKVDSKDSINSIAKANGLYYGFAMVPRIYFGEHIGLSINLGYTAYTYPNILFSNKNDSNVNDNNDRKFNLKANGVNIGVGLLVKF